jgi:hypothetical protein
LFKQSITVEAYDANACCSRRKRPGYCAQVTTTLLFLHNNSLTQSASFPFSHTAKRHL